MLEECSYCHRRFRFDRIAKHETRCPESKPKPAKLDVVRKLLAGTPGEQHIPAARQDVQNGKKLPPLMVKPKESWLADGLDGLCECSRCGRRFSQEALEKHARHCSATPRHASAPHVSRESMPCQSQARTAGDRPLSSRSVKSKTVAPSREQKENRSNKINGIAASQRSVNGSLPGTDAAIQKRSCGHTSYEQLEVDVSNWLDD